MLPRNGCIYIFCYIDNVSSCYEVNDDKGPSKLVREHCSVMQTPEQVTKEPECIALEISPVSARTTEF